MTRLEKFMESEGWTRRKRYNGTKVYHSWRKEGIEIEEEDIEDVWENRR